MEQQQSNLEKVVTPMNKKIIVTGNLGYIGPHLTRLLAEKGFDVVGIDSNYFNEDCWFFTPFQNFTQVHKDVRQLTVADLEGAYAVCHLAALSNDPMGKQFEEPTYEINHHASVNIAKMAKEAGVERFIFSSSCSMYGVAGDSALTEEAEQAPVTAYAKSKVFTERDTFPLLSDTFSVTSLRNATAYGVSPLLRTDLVVNDLVGSAYTTGKIVIKSDGTPWRPLVHCEDIARAFVAVVEADKERIHGQSFNVGRNEDNYRIKEIAEAVKEAMPECEILITNEFGGDTRNYRVNFDKIARQLPEFQPQWTVKTGIKQLLEAYKEHDLKAEDFQSRKYVRLKQLTFLLDQHKVNNQLYYI